MNNYRNEWKDAMLKIVSPVLDALEAGELKRRLPTNFHEKHSDWSHLEAFGRSMLGFSAWLEADSSKLGEEERRQQEQYRAKALRCIAMAVDPKSPDFMNFATDRQPLVDTAFLAHALVRAPKALVEPLPAQVRHNLAEAFRSSRQITPNQNNWIFFSAMVEAGLKVLDEPFDMTRVLYAVRTFQDWYKGDGIYGDGARFCWDYYNSFVIQPMYVDLVELFYGENAEIAAMRPDVLARSSRYASELERMIGPDGSYPVIGRSICYRFGAFQMLAQTALQHRLEPQLTPAAVRCGLTAVIRRVMSSPDMFDEEGWLRPGVYGYQPELAETYICVGSLYLCSSVFLPLGLSPEDPFWSAPDEEWSGRKVWSGGHITIDHAIKI